jgi:hypothetical protein
MVMIRLRNDGNKGLRPRSGGDPPWRIPLKRGRRRGLGHPQMSGTIHMASCLGLGPYEGVVHEWWYTVHLGRKDIKGKRYN